MGRSPVANTRASRSSPYQRIIALWTGNITRLLSAKFTRISCLKGRFSNATASGGRQSSSVNPVSITNLIGKSAHLELRNGMVIMTCPSSTISESLNHTLHDTTTKSSTDVVPDFDAEETGIGMFLAQEVSST